MIYNIKTFESSSHDALPSEWKLQSTQRQYIYIKPPKIINDITGIYIVGLSGGIVYLGSIRHKTIAMNGAQPGFDLLATSEVIK